MLNQNDLEPFVMPLINGISQGQIIGACRRQINVRSKKSKNGKLLDCIDLTVPYADQSLKWTILFDADYPELGPDFIFNDENFLADPAIDTLIKYVPSLANWNYLDSDSLFIVIKDLLAYYKDHQVDLLRNQDSGRLICEYESLIENFCADDVEVILLNPGMKSAEAKFFIKLEMDFSRLPQRIKRSSNDAVMLLVTFSGPNWQHVVPQLYLSKSVEEIFGNQEHLQIPLFNNDTLLIEYVPKVINFLSDKVDLLILNFKKKKEFLSSLLIILRRSVVEYDAVEFNKSTFLVEKKDFHFFIHFKIPPAFPREMPEVILQSAYHMDQSGKLLMQTVTKLPYSSQMEPFHMILMILRHIEENEVELFQSFCTKKNRI